MRQKKVALYVLIVTVALCAVIIFVIHQTRISRPQAAKNLTTIHSRTFQDKTYETTATLAAVGDILIHDRVYNKAKTPTGYDFKPMLALVKPYIKKADIAVANQETMIGGTEIVLSSYPSFNSPYEVGDALKDAGFNVVTMANNHTLDRGSAAIKNAIHHWDDIGMIHTGSFLSEKDRQTIRTISRNGIVVSFLAYTYGTNGIPSPKNQDYLVNRIDLPRMMKDVKRAKQISDVTVVALHFGIEYERMPNQSQKDLVKKLADQGVDIIIGNHPHVLQPFGWVQGKTGHRTFVAYSLGNFFSGQDDGIYKEIGGILTLPITKKLENHQVKIDIGDPEFIPTWVNPKNYHVIPLKDAANYGLDQASELYQETMKHMSSIDE